MSIEKLMEQISGFDERTDGVLIDRLVQTADESVVEQLERELFKSRWPRCGALASALRHIGTDRARSALIACLKAKRHHVRTAAIEALTGFEDPGLADLLEPFLDDPAFETRFEAKKVITALTGRNVTTSRGE